MCITNYHCLNNCHLFGGIFYLSDKVLLNFYHIYIDIVLKYFSKMKNIQLLINKLPRFEMPSVAP